jgi:hypothetical protein
MTFEADSLKKIEDRLGLDVRGNCVSLTRIPAMKIWLISAIFWELLWQAELFPAA